jgi:flavin-dependent dehydrogenase
MSAETSEAVVVGAGPAGSAAAYTLAAAGKTVCLIDKATFPRDKLCGGGLTFRSKRAFERVFRRTWNPSLFNSSRNISFFSKGRFLAAVKLNTSLYFTSRLRFDHYLLDLARDAGATLKLGDRVTWPRRC